MLAKAAAGLGADEVVIDLEDAVAPGAKDEARAAVITALEGWNAGHVSVRINAPRSRWCHLDVIALAALGELPVSLVVPKVEGAGDLAFMDRLLDGAEAASHRPIEIRLQALIETATGLERVSEIAASSARLDSLILGYADLAAALGRSRAATEDLETWLPAQHTLLTAARAHGLQAIDGPYLRVEVDEQFRAGATRARDLGFDGKWAIHPTQVQPLNELFTPSADEVEWARSVITALERAEQDHGRGAVALDGQMLDEAIRAAALRVLARSPD
jgi:citrate lyase subunit beta / citryl-CoA lyase